MQKGVKSLNLEKNVRKTYVEDTVDKFWSAGVDIQELPQRPNMEHLYGLNILGWVIKYVNEVK